ncbi:MAG TPA: hypothetical protein VFV17_02500, partial [Usitatibacteraceae bacterium]|nr:hypothetical protein [Usitatibacteraceae bacterium]
MRTTLQQQIRRAALALALTCAANAQAAFTITTFTYPGSVATRGWQINDMLQVATTAELASGTPAFAGAVYQFSSGTFTTLPPFAPGVVASPVGINNAAVTTGAAPDEVTGEGPGFLFGAAYSTFNYPGAVFTSGRGVNLAGKVTGYWQAADDSVGGFIYDSIAHTYTDIVIPGAQFMIPHGINAAGTVSGSVILSPGSAFAGAPGGQYGFIRAATGALTLYRVNGLPTRSRGINDSGRVAGWLTDAPGSSKGFVINAPSGGGYVNVA